LEPSRHWSLAQNLPAYLSFTYILRSTLCCRGSTRSLPMVEISRISHHHAYRDGDCKIFIYIHEKPEPVISTCPEGPVVSGFSMPVQQAATCSTNGRTDRSGRNGSPFHRRYRSQPPTRALPGRTRIRTACRTVRRTTRQNRSGTRRSRHRPG